MHRRKRSVISRELGESCAFADTACRLHIVSCLVIGFISHWLRQKLMMISQNFVKAEQNSMTGIVGRLGLVMELVFFTTKAVSTFVIGASFREWQEPCLT